MIFNFLIFQMATKPISANFDMSNTKIVVKLFKISQSRPTGVNF